MVVRIDLHGHGSTASKVLDPEKVRKAVLRNLGFGGIWALVNYADRRFEAFRERVDRIAQEKGYDTDGRVLDNAVFFPRGHVLVVKGEETRTNKGDFLVLGMDAGDHLKMDEGFYSMVQEGAGKGLGILTSPFFRSGTGEAIRDYPDSLQHISAIETHNGSAVIPGANGKAREFYDLATRWAQERGYGTIGESVCSDGHSIFEIGSSWRVADCNPDSYRDLRSGDQVRDLLRGALAKPIGKIKPEGVFLMSDSGSNYYDAPERRERRHHSYVGAAKHVAELAAIRFGGGRFGKGDKVAHIQKDQIII